MTPPRNLKAAVVRRADELGFDACRVATAAPPESAPRLRAWLASGQHGDMAYLVRNADRRANPAAVLPGARSVITVAVSYAHPIASDGSRNQTSPSALGTPHSALRTPHSAFGTPHSSPTVPSAHELAAGLDLPRRGRVARYAQHRDYHDVLRPPLQALAEFISELGGPDTRSCWYVDTGPVLERDLAQRAGLGFIGKHTNLISRTQGNWFFIAEVLTTLALEPDVPEPNRCGRCTRCLAACPTQAIVARFQLDARRCISYLTIEARGPIPVELRPAVGDRLFGCDDCLEVCPWNRFARAGRLMAETRWTDDAGLDFLELLALDEAGFRSRFAGTPLLRAGHRGLQRNVCVALGNVGDARAKPALERVARGLDPLVAEHARWAIAQIERRTETEPRGLGSEPTA